MAKYHISKQILTDKNGDFITTYGIAVVDKNKVRIISDITPDRFKIEKLIEKFNKHKLSSCHIDDAIEDFLYDQSVD